MAEIYHLFQEPHELQRGRDAALQNPWEKFQPNRSTALAFCATRCILLQCGSGRFPRATVALLGRFLPRLGPLPQGERPLSFRLRCLVFWPSASCAPAACRKPIPLPPDRAEIPPAGSRQDDPTAARIPPPSARTRPTARSGARPYT